MKKCGNAMSSAAVKCGCYKEGECVKRDSCVYQVEHNVIYETEVVDGHYIFPFDCECGHEWTQTSILPCSHILAVCGSCGTEVNYSVVERDKGDVE